MGGFVSGCTMALQLLSPIYPSLPVFPCREWNGYQGTGAVRLSLSRSPCTQAPCPICTSLHCYRGLIVDASSVLMLCLCVPSRAQMYAASVSQAGPIRSLNWHVMLFCPNSGDLKKGVGVFWEGGSRKLTCYNRNWKRQRDFTKRKKKEAETLQLCNTLATGRSGLRGYYSSMSYSTLSPDPTKNGVPEVAHTPCRRGLFVDRPQMRYYGGTSQDRRTTTKA